MKNIIFLLTFSTIALTGCSSNSHSPNFKIQTDFVSREDYGKYKEKHGGFQPVNVSPINLIATPEKYHGVYVRVIGFYTNEMENSSITITKEFKENALIGNSIWVNFFHYSAPGSSNAIQKRQQEKPRNYNQKYVLLEGQFNMNSHGHMGMFAGTIENTTRFDEWKPH